MRDGYIVGKPHWVDPAGEGCVVGFLATGETSVCDVEQGVSSRHLRLWFEDGSWWAQDLDSANGTWLRPAGENGGAASSPASVSPWVRVTSSGSRRPRASCW